MLFRRNNQKRREVMLGLDLGTSSVKAAVVRRQGEKLQLAEYGIRPLPAGNGKSVDPAFGEQVQQLLAGFKYQDRAAAVTLSCSSAIVCHTDFPRMPLAEVKNALKLNSARYLRRDFSNYFLDAVELPPLEEAKGKTARMRVLVGGANREEVVQYRDALLAAKIRPDVVELAAISVVNAFLLTRPEMESEVVLLVDIGARVTSINFLLKGQPVITRIMHFGGAQLSEYVGQILMLEGAAAEEEKIRMSDPVQALVKTAISPLARELRSSIDFFERQHECHLSCAFACGGSAASPRTLEFLSEAVGVNIEGWNAVAGMDTSHFNGEANDVLALGSALTAAIGAAAARL